MAANNCKGLLFELMAAAEYGYIDGVEHLSDYRPGGHHPVHIDDRLENRYRIVHKLGHGTFSTAWLAIDDKTSKYVAVKVGTADADFAEANVLIQLKEGASSAANSKDRPPLIPTVLDRFHFTGPNGTHPCLVTLPARCSLREAKEASGSCLFQLDVARSLAVQLVMAVSIVHAKGYAHGEHLYAKYGEPEKEAVIRLDTQAASTDPGVPSYVVPAVWLGAPSNEITLGEAKLLLSDFGTAFRPSDQSRFESYTPLILRPPEAFFEPTTPLTFASDIWSLGCVIFELLAHRSLIDGFLTPQDEITAQQVELQGIMPPGWWARWEQRAKWYDETGRSLSSPGDVWSLERRFEQWVQNPRRSKSIGSICDDERAALFELLRRMRAWRSSDRPDAKQILEAEWVTRWALPAYDRSLQGN
ncbi:kinase-like domain-containing protein [Plectosphaerella cucumerina]|uniref:non-specific serine/threonine protein kinase n=1 Tax=Plectosphaerella cucumerina TaxID=40658 RepID=A0A8K0T934_9PEZI|nr:kinase-like domain-containing protein [Plectosphaerella cucumerina]